MNSTLGVIIVMHKQKHNLLRLYDSLSKQTFKNFKVYFVDNNSGSDEIDFSKELNGKFSLDITYIDPDYNSGFAGGNNLGAAEAIKNGCKYIFFLNNDTSLDACCIENLLKTVESPGGFDAAAPLLLYGDDEKGNGDIVQEFGAACDFERYKIRKHFEKHSLSASDTQIPDVLPSDLLSGAAILMKTEAFKSSGMWEECYFAYGDEIDLFRRLKDNGFKSAAVKTAKLWHYHKWTRSNKQGYYFEYYLIERNKFLYYRKFRLRFRLTLSVLEDLLKFPWRLIWFIKVCDLKLGMYYLRGMLHGLMNKKGKPDISF